MLEMENHYCHHYSNQLFMNKNKNNNNNGKLIHFSHLIILILLLIFNVTSANHHVMHNVVKRMDLESCLGRFDVHSDTIIRTEESRSMGAKFLDDADLSSREQCLRLCCETDGCDVFVFEEKSQGTCFLFQCGPSENFRCKFTKHSNYSSAVLGVQPPQAPSLPNSSQVHGVKPPAVSVVLSQHEQELANLRGGKSNNVLTTTTTVLPRLGELAATEASKQTATNHCGRFQFACHSGECIAVYNACDGIPQCEDGSDEGPECPSTSKSEPVKADNIQTNPSGLAPALTLDYQKPQDRTAFQTDVLQQQQQQVLSPQSLLPHNREDPMTAPKQWPHQTSNMEPLPDSHIFNHKGGIQIASNNNGGSQYTNDLIQSNYKSQSNSRDSYMQPLPVDPYRNQLIQQQQQQWLQDQQSRLSPSRLDWPQQKQMAQESVLQQVVSDTIVANKWPEIEAPVSNKNQKDEIVVQDKSEDKTVDTYYDDEDDTKPTEPPKKKQRKHKKLKNKEGKDKNKKTDDDDESNPHHEQLKLIKTELGLEFPDHDGLSQRPGGAMLSLTLGVIISAALAILIGCRMRVVGRRIRRHGKAGYAHDADFLVNGMYL